MSHTLELAKALIARPSVTPDDKGCQEILAERLSAVGFTIEHYPINETHNLWAKLGTEEPVLCFAGHTDVVPPGEGWTTSPFEPTIRDGKLFGRGATDMKSSVAAMVTAVERFLKNPNRPLKGSIAFLITSDEEGPAHDGTQAVLKILKEKNAIPKYCLVGEASSVDNFADVIKVGRRGSLTGKCLIKGIQGHVAYPHLGKNAIHIALKPLDDIAQLSFDETVAPFPKTTLQIANIQAGTGATNVIPGKLTVDFNIRYSPNYKPDQLQKRIEEIFNAYPIDYEIEWINGSKPFLTNPESFLIQKVIEAITDFTGKEPQALTTGGTSDGRFFAEYGSEVVEVGPINATAHHVDEHIALTELEQLSQLYEAILAKMLL